MGGDPPPGYSSGGMRTKLVAARIATQAGCAMAIALGHTDRPLSPHLVAGARCTWFLPAEDGRSARKRWIAGSLHPAGTITIDLWRRPSALAAGRSLLPAGVRTIEGEFERGDPVLIQSADRHRPGARPLRLCQRRRAPHRRPSTRPRSRRYSAGAAATNSFTATTSR